MDAQTRNNVLTGAFLLTAVFLAVIVSFVLSEIRFESRSSYVVRFPVSVGAGGLDAGSPLLVGGQPAGEVRGVRFDFDDKGRADSILVDVEVRRDMALYVDARVTLERPLIGTLSALNITHSGGDGDAARLADGGELLGIIAPPSFLAGAGFGEDEAAGVSRIIAKAETFMDEANRVAASVDLENDPAVAELRAAIADVAASVARVRETMETQLPGWEGDVSGALASARSTFQGGEAAVAQINDAVASVRPDFESAVGDVSALAERVRSDWEQDGGPTLEASRAGFESFAAMAADAEAFVAAEGDGIARILANGRLASDQLKLATIEIRSAPWRLLTRPDTKELESQLIYDAARAYAMAASDLRASTDALQSLGAHAEAAADAGGEPDRATLDAIRSTRAGLTAAFERFQDAERGFLELLIEQR